MHSADRPPKLVFALRPRLRAAGLHAAASLAVAAGLSALLVQALYPAPYFHAAGGLRLLAMMIAIDAIIGPCLTFAVFDTRKPRAELRRDLTVIVVLQLAALGYGLYSTALGRPVFQTLAVDRFELVSAAEVDPDELNRAPQALRALSWSGPKLAAAVRPTDPAEREELLLASTAGIDLRHLLSRYVSYESMRAQVIAKAQPFDALAVLNGASAVSRAVADLRADAKISETDLGWLPVSGRSEDLVAFVDRRDGRLLRVERLRPW